MKKIKMLLVFVLVVIMLAGCTPQGEVNKAPSVVGVKDIQCIVNSTVDFLDGVAALDKEDGDITPNLQITVTPQVEVNDGYATFTQVGEYTVTYQITDSQGRSAQKRAYVDVMDRETYKTFAMPEGFVAETNGAATIETCGMINGVFKLNAKNGEIAEDIKLIREFSLSASAFSATDYLEYTFNYTVKSNVAGKIKATADGNDCAELSVAVGENQLSFTHSVLKQDEKHEVEIALCLGGLSGDVEWEISKVNIEYPQQEGKEVTLVDQFNFAGSVTPRCEEYDSDEKVHTGLDGNGWALEDGSGARLEIKDPGTNTKIWLGGMFINTGITVKSGETYIISFKVKCVPLKDRVEKDNFEILFQRGQWAAPVYDKVMNPTADSETGEVTVSKEFTPNDDNEGDLWIYVQSGTQANQITLSSLSVVERFSAVGKDKFAISDFIESHNGAYNSTFTTDRGNFTYVIDSFSSADGDHKVTSPSFYVAGSGANYVVTFKAKASAPIDMIVAAPVYGGWDPTIFWHQVKLSEQETVFTFFCNGNGSDRLYTLEWHFGSANNQQYHNVTIEITDIKVSLRNGELDG
ncbi:MAG: carbohydrate binding domain-containing protein [Clostridiales bacterium]|nr:carbohydrate binding domain-containing protein [Clostridiales bacterium]